MKNNNYINLTTVILLSIIMLFTGCSSSDAFHGTTTMSDTLGNGRCLWFDVLSDDDIIDREDTVIAVRVFDNGLVDTYYTNYDFRYYYSRGEITLGDVSKLNDDEIIELAKTTEASICQNQCEDLKEALNIIDRFYAGDEIHYDVDLDNVYFYNAYDTIEEELVSDDMGDLYNSLYEYYSDGIQRTGTWDVLTGHEYALSIKTDGSGNNTETEGIIQYASDCFNLVRTFNETVASTDIYDNFFGGYKSVDPALVYDMEMNLYNEGRGNSIYGDNIYLLTKCSDDTEFVLDEPDYTKFVVDGEVYDGAPQSIVDVVK